MESAFVDSERFPSTRRNGHREKFDELAKAQISKRREHPHNHRQQN